MFGITRFYVSANSLQGCSTTMALEQRRTPQLRVRRSYRYAFTDQRRRFVSIDARSSPSLFAPAGRLAPIALPGSRLALRRRLLARPIRRAGRTGERNSTCQT